MNGPVLVVAAHPDDEVFGCGGTISRWASEGRTIDVLLIADGENSRAVGESQMVEAQLLEKRNAAARNACRILGCSSVQLLALPDNRLDRLELLDIVKKIEGYIEKLKPVTLLTHHAGDVNIDHRVVHDAVITACRPQPGHPVQELLFFEVPSSTEWRPPGSAAPFLPNYFVDITNTLETKLAALQPYETEIRDFPHPRSLKAIKALARWRGATVGVEAAESFILGRKLISNQYISL